MKLAVVLMGLMLVTSTAVTLTDTSFAQRKQATNLEFEMSGCVNSVTCGAVLFVGDVVEFDGRLTTADGTPIQGAAITVYKFLPTPELVPIATGVTGIDGDISLSWKAAFTEKERHPGDVTRKIQNEVVKIFAQFDGDDRFASSRSGMNTATINANELNIFVNSDKNLYRQGESAIIFIAFIDSHDEFVDPDSLRVVLNNREVQVERMAEGSYVLTTNPLPKEHTQVFVIPRKDGYNTTMGFLTMIVDGVR